MDDAELEALLMEGVNDISDEELEAQLLAGIDDIEDEGTTVRTEPVTAVERLIFQNFFDTQPEKRRAYAKQIGLELDPKDDNKFRPLGSKGAYEGEIDPGVDAYFKKGGLAEIFKDIGDVGFDMLVATPADVAGTVAGGAAGIGAGIASAPATGGAGAVVLPAAGAILGGAAGNYAAEEFKDGIANMILDEEIPMDRSEALVQSAIVGAIPFVGKMGKNLGKGVMGARLSNQKDAAISVLKETGKIGDEAIEKIVADPEAYSKEAVSQGKKNFSDFYKAFFGLDPEKDVEDKVRKLRRPVKGSVFDQKLAPLRTAQQAEIDKLSRMPQANFTYEEITTPIREELMRLKGLGNPKKEQKKAIKVLQSQLDAADKTFGVDKSKQGLDPLTLTPKQQEIKPIDYRQAKSFLEGLQDSAFKETAVGSLSENPVISGVAGGLRRRFDEKAQSLGSQLPQINAQMSDALETFKMSAMNLKPSQMVSHFGLDQDKDKVRTVLGRIDKALGENYTEQFESGALKAQMENVYKNTPVGSSQKLGILTREAGKGATKGGLAGISIGGAGGALAGGQYTLGAGLGGVLGAGLGAAQGVKRGVMLADPEKNLRSIAKATSKIQSLEAPKQMAEPGSLRAFLESTGPAAAAIQGSKMAVDEEVSEEELERRLLEGI